MNPNPAIAAEVVVKKVLLLICIFFDAPGMNSEFLRCIYQC